MLVTVSSFVGAFAAMLVLAEINAQSKVVRYVAAFVCGLLLAVVLGWAVGLIAHILPGKVG